MGVDRRILKPVRAPLGDLVIGRTPEQNDGRSLVLGKETLDTHSWP